ncbi:MAG: DUF1549 domain-containing protein [Planctomycetota bacterium]|nr:MAG: DUF1549 domain-containing protein [Planctomycetota bacterium]
MIDQRREKVGAGVEKRLQWTEPADGWTRQPSFDRSTCLETYPPTPSLAAPGRFPPSGVIDVIPIAEPPSIRSAYRRQCALHCNDSNWSWQVLVGLFLVAGYLVPAVAEELPSVTYERDVRPILKTHCFHCHGEEGQFEGGLDLRLQRLILQGGDSGTAVVPGDPTASLLLGRMQDGEMPPEEIETRPSAEEVARIERWIAQGARTARPEPADLDPNAYLTEEERSYWAYQPVQRVDPPDVRHRHQVQTPIDQFVLAKLEPLGLRLSQPAERRTLIRRLYFDLHGLPPSSSRVQQFVNDGRPDAYERLVDELLASPRYGERWGRHWLDVAGYADSEGYTDEDPERPWAFHYRDYVLRALNADKPFDEFITEQIAGDELVTQPFRNLSASDRDKLIATGFLRMAPDGTGGVGSHNLVAKNDVIAGTIEILSSALLGLTVGCAQCHDHRYDPISQEDYYALRAIFEPAFHPSAWLPPAQRRISLYTESDLQRAAEIEQQALAVLAERDHRQADLIAATFERELAKLPEEVREAVRAAYETAAAKRSAEQKELLKLYPSVNVSAGSLYLYDRQAADELKKLADRAAEIRNSKPQEEFVRALWEPAGTSPEDTHLFARGDPEQPKQVVGPRALRILTQHCSPAIPDDDPHLPTTGRRLAYARWLVGGDHPLVARVIVNRVWLGHFGRGLVATPADLGRLGVPPTHPELLDWLATEFVEKGWSLKHLHRVILLSRTYQQDAKRAPNGESVDRENRFYWRWSLRRLDAESLRDALLMLSGDLNLRTGGPPVPVMADRVGQFVIGRENLNAGRPGPVIDMQGEQFRRTVYVQFRRSRPLSAIAPFDLPRMSPNCKQRNVSTVATQSLLLMNSPFVWERAAQMALRARRLGGEQPAAQVEWIWCAAYGHPPTDAESQAAVQFVAQQAAQFAAQGAMPEQALALEADDLALASLCHAVISSNEFLYVD